MNIRINRVAHTVFSLGPGQRVVLWVQGCSRRCPGCASTDTWDYNAGENIDVESLSKMLIRIILDNNITGLTITGGEPVDQAESLMLLLKFFNNEVNEKIKDRVVDVLMFSGYTMNEINEICPNLLTELTAMVCGKYDQTRPRTNCLVSSDNQELVIIDKQFEDIYDEYLAKNDVPIQFKLDSSGITFAGMPNSGDLDIIDKKLRSKGIVLGGKTWQN